MSKQLDGVTVAILVADGFEQVEVTGPMRALKQAGADVRVISLRPGRLRGMNFVWRGRKLPVDDTVFGADPEAFSALLLPGGFVSPDLLRQSDRAREFVRRIDQLGRPIAVICHGPEVLVSAGLVRDRRLTSWPGIADDVRNAGGMWEDSAVVRDRNWISSRGPQDLPAFETAMLELFAEQAQRGLQVPRRPMRALATAARLATYATGGVAIAGLGALALGGGRRVAMQTRSVRPTTDAVAIIHDLALAGAFGGMLFSKVALDPAARAFPQPNDRGRMVVAPWRKFVVPATISLGAAIATWAAREREHAFVHAPRLTRTKDALLGITVLTGAINAVAGLSLARAERVPMVSGARPSPDGGRTARMHRIGLFSGYGHLVALAATIGIGAMLARRAAR